MANAFSPVVFTLVPKAIELATATTFLPIAIAGFSINPPLLLFVDVPNA